MAEEFEDPIEAIKRRNEERARRLKERIARGEFDRFETPLEEVDESLVAGPEGLEAPESEFDLSSFPAPPEPSSISFDEERAIPLAEPPEIPLTAPPELRPEYAPPPETAAFAVPPEPELPPVEEPVEDVLAGLELTELDLEGVGEIVAPQPWDTFEALPMEEALPAELAPAGLEIEVERAAEARPEQIRIAPLEEEVPVAPEPAAVSEPALREEEAEAIKATIEEELREVPPAAPPMPPRPKEVPVGVAAEVVPEPAAPKREEPAKEEEAEIFIGIEVLGNKVRIERRNITLAGAVDLFKSIIDRYQNR